MHLPLLAARRLAILALTLLLPACTEPRGTAATAQTPSPCEPPRHVADLPENIVEASGIVFSPSQPGVVWVHNDSDRHLYALDRNGALQARVALPGSRPRDWEDIAAGPCAGGGSCLYLADIGDNSGARPEIAVLRVPEPSLADSETAAPERMVFRYPDGPRDAEALFLLAGRIHIVSKGRNGPIALYRAPAASSTRPAVLERVRSFKEGLAQLPDQVTGADATPDGRWVVLRTYSYLDLYAIDGDTLPSFATARVTLATLREPQGEGVALNADGEVMLVSERALGRPGSLSYLRCQLR